MFDYSSLGFTVITLLRFCCISLAKMSTVIKKLDLLLFK